MISFILCLYMNQHYLILSLIDEVSIYVVKRTRLTSLKNQINLFSKFFKTQKFQWIKNFYGKLNKKFLSKTFLENDFEPDNSVSWSFSHCISEGKTIKVRKFMEDLRSWRIRKERCFQLNIFLTHLLENSKLRIFRNKQKRIFMLVRLFLSL